MDVKDFGLPKKTNSQSEYRPSFYNRQITAPGDSERSENSMELIMLLIEFLTDCLAKKDYATADLCSRLIVRLFADYVKKNR